MKKRNLLFDWLPPKAVDLLRRVPRRYGWFGNYASWEKAVADCSGYQSPGILEKVRDAGLRVKGGHSAFERDSVVFPEIEYSWPLLAQLMHIAACGQGRLHVLDFGGALGSTYFQNRKFFEGLKEVRWCVVEQSHFVQCGREHFQSEELRFYQNIEECVNDGAPLAVLLSCVLQYLPDPDALLNALLKHQFQFIVIDRTGFSNDGLEHITVQRVHPEIYAASYPCYFLSRQKLLAKLAPSYEMLAELPAPDKCNYPGHFRGFVFRRR
jgi:putative methyltransferase (TIGR04325 family)